MENFRSQNIEILGKMFFEIEKNRSQKYFRSQKFSDAKFMWLQLFLFLMKLFDFFIKSLFLREEHAQHTSGMGYARDTVGIRSGYGFPKRDTFFFAMVTQPA